ncbi:hypothetical protein [Actinoallomurus acaciae]|uniref:Uncharacterized protein n=1 Tax=Actinoallomurus acaciae TaxID=502577 RepID=A0ABV5YBF6_9ACTN
MGTVVQAAAVQDLPEPTSYRGQHLVDLPIDDDAWLRSQGGSHWLAPTVDPGLAGVCWEHPLNDQSGVAVKDVVIPIDFGEPVPQALNDCYLYFKLSATVEADNA